MGLSLDLYVQGLKGVLKLCINLSLKITTLLRLKDEKCRKIHRFRYMGLWVTCVTLADNIMLCDD